MSGRKKGPPGGEGGASATDLEGTSFAARILDHVADPVLVKDEQHRWVVLNQAFCDFMGHSREELVGKSDFDFLPPEEARVFWEKDALVFATGEANLNIERLTDAEGVTHIVSTRKTMFVDENGRKLLVGVIRDVTEDVRAAEALREQQKELQRKKDAAEKATLAKAEFLANVSHELRTPMHAVIGMANLLLSAPLEEEQRSHVQTILESSDGLLSLINDLLDLEKAGVGKIKLEREPFRLEACVRTAVEILAPKAHEKRLQLISRVDPAVPAWLHGDARRLRQILLNLIGNAVKFTEQGGVHVSVNAGEVVGEHCDLVIEVHDTGLGISRDGLERVFEPFSQLSRSKTGEAGGTGLGLTIAKQLAQLMGGDVTVDSAPDRGSVFCFRVRLQVAPPRTEQSDPPKAPFFDLAARHPLRILIAEDNPVNQRVAVLLLARLGYRVDLASTGLEALEAVRRVAYDVVFMDLQMPEMGGLEATERLYQEIPPARMPYVLAVTASAIPSQREACLAAGMHDYLVKPVSPEALVAALERCPARTPARQGPDVD